MQEETPRGKRLQEKTRGFLARKRTRRRIATLPFATRARLDFNHREETYNFNVAPFWRKIDYIEGEFFSQHAFGWTATFNWLFRPTFALALSTGREHRDYTGLDRTDTDASYSMALSWRQTSHWTWVLRGTHALRDSTLREAGYSDNAIILSLTYTR